jgi:hypothetical protein
MALSCYLQRCSHSRARCNVCASHRRHTVTVVPPEAPWRGSAELAIRCFTAVSKTAELHAMLKTLYLIGRPADASLRT